MILIFTESLSDYSFYNDCYLKMNDVRSDIINFRQYNKLNKKFKNCLYFNGPPKEGFYFIKNEIEKLNLKEKEEFLNFFILLNEEYYNVL